MDDTPGGLETVHCATNPAWWTPAVLVVLVIPGQLRSGDVGWWLADVAVLVVCLAVLYVSTHPTLTFSSAAITMHRGPLRTSIVLDDLASIRANVRGRRTAVRDPETGESRSLFRFYAKYADDWAGSPPVLQFLLRDSKGHAMTLGTNRTGADRWAPLLLRAIQAQPEVELGPRVLEALTLLAR